MVVQTEIAFEHATHPFHEAGVGMQAGHLVLVLVGHQLEQAARHLLGQAGAAQGRLGLPHLLDEAAVLRRIGAILVGGEEFGTADHQAVQRFPRREGNDLTRLGQRPHRGGVVRGMPAPGKSGLVGLDRHAIELDGA